MPRQTSFSSWFKENFRIPERNVSLYMRRMLKSAFEAGYDSAIDEEKMKQVWKAGYTVGFRKGQR